jgi:hypothetical protein
MANQYMLCHVLYNTPIMVLQRGCVGRLYMYVQWLEALSNANKA